MLLTKSLIKPAKNLPNGAVQKFGDFSRKAESCPRKTIRKRKRHTMVNRKNDGQVISPALRAVIAHQASCFSITNGLLMASGTRRSSGQLRPFCPMSQSSITLLVITCVLTKANNPWSHSTIRRRNPRLWSCVPDHAWLSAACRQDPVTNERRTPTVQN